MYHLIKRILRWTVPVVATSKKKKKKEPKQKCRRRRSATFEWGKTVFPREEFRFSFFFQFAPTPKDIIAYPNSA